MKLKTVLIADDDPSILMIVKAILGRSGFNLVSARDGKEAHQILQKTTINLLITDEVMPYVTGTDLSRWMREEDHLRKIPIILMSAEENPLAFSKLLKDRTIDGFLSKPFNTTALIDMLKLHIIP